MRTQERARYSAHRDSRCRDRMEASERPRLAGLVTRGLAAKAPRAPSLAKGFLSGQRRSLTSRLGTGCGAQHRRNSLRGSGPSRLDRLAHCKVAVTIVTARTAPNFHVISSCYEGHRASQDPYWQARSSVAVGAVRIVTAVRGFERLAPSKKSPSRLPVFLLLPSHRVAQRRYFEGFGAMGARTQRRPRL
jgi:hypothetical protein